MVTIMKNKIGKLVGIFKNIGGNIPGGNFPGWDSPGGSLIVGNFPGGTFPSGSFPDTEENICEEFSSVHPLTLIFIRKILLLQTHSLRI